MLRMLIVLGVLLTIPAQAEDRISTLSLSGTGSVSVAPDSATVYVGVETQKETAAEALAANSEAAGRVIGALKAAGVASEQIQTSNFSVSPVYSERKSLSSDAPSVVGYRIGNQVTARIRDLDGLGALLDALVNTGANRINGVSFDVEDDREAMDAAREKAVAAARHNAEVYAKAAGVTLGPILSISEGGTSLGARGGVAFAQSARSAAPIERGETSLSASVTIVWELR